MGGRQPMSDGGCDLHNNVAAGVAILQLADLGGGGGASEPEAQGRAPRSGADRRRARVCLASADNLAELKSRRPNRWRLESTRLGGPAFAR